MDDADRTELPARRAPDRSPLPDDRRDRARGTRSRREVARIARLRRARGQRRRTGFGSARRLGRGAIAAPMRTASARDADWRPGPLPPDVVGTRVSVDGGVTCGVAVAASTPPLLGLGVAVTDGFGVAVADGLGVSVGCDVGGAVGCAVGCSVGLAVGCSVGWAVGC